MNQAKQATSVTDSDIDAAVQDERMVELERRIIALEEQAARDRTQVVADAAAIHVVGSTIYDLQQEVMEQAQRIERLEAATGSIVAIETIKALGQRIEKLERRAILNADEEQRLQVVANTAVINNMHGQIGMLQQQVGEAIIALAGGGITNDGRLGKLETALQDVARCLINGKVDKAMQTAGELHSHRILGTKAVETMIKVYLRLKE